MSFLMAEGFKNYVKEAVFNFINKTGRIPTKKDMLEENISIEPLISTYGTWTNVLKALDCYKKDNRVSVTEEETFELLYKLQEKIGSIPTFTQVKKEKIDITILLKEYGKWSVVKEVLKGRLDKETAKKDKDKALIFDLEKTTEILIEETKRSKRIPTRKQANEMGLNTSKLIELFGSWENVINELNIYKTHEERVVLQLDTITELQKKRPTLMEIRERKIDVSPLINKYGSWRKACEELNLDSKYVDIESIKEQVIELAKKLNRRPTVLDVQKEEIDVKSLIREYKGWKNVVKELDLDRFEINEIKEEILMLSEELDRTPKFKDLVNNKINVKKILSKYKKWSIFRTKIGLPTFSKFSNTQLKEKEQQILDLADELKKTPTIRDINAKKLKITALINRYGSWNNVLSKLGLKLNTRYTEQEIKDLCDKIIDLSKKLNKTPTIKDLKKHGISVAPLIRKYNSYNECLLSIGLTPNYLSETLYVKIKESILTELTNLSKKLGKVPSMMTAKKFNIKVYSLLRDMGNWTNVKEELALRAGFKTIDSISTIENDIKLA